MAKRIQWCGKKYIEGEIGIGWERTSNGHYQTEMFDVTYELEKRRRNTKDQTFDSGWYLYSRGASEGNFFGEWCARTILDAVDSANEQILKADLRAERE